jgi:hypothetical protein
MSSDQLDLPTSSSAKSAQKKTLSNGANEIMALNRIKYTFPDSASVVTKRRNVTSFFDRSSYTNNDGEMIIKVNSSTDYVNGGNCYLKFKVQVTLATGAAATDVYHFDETAGALSLFDRVLIESRDGTQVERVEHAGDCARNSLYLNCPRDYIRTVGEAAGITVDANGAAALGSGADLKTEQEYLIPMWWLSGLYGPDNTLLPAQLTSGMRIRISLAPVLKALYKDNTVDEVVKYTISNPVLVHDNVTLSPMVQRALMQQCGNVGLDYAFYTHYEQGGPASSTAINFEVNKSVSRAMSLMWIYQEAQNTAAPQGNVGIVRRMGTSANRNVRQFVRLGSLFWPNTEITTTSAEHATEFYYNTVAGVKKASNCQDQMAVSYSQFRNVAGSDDDLHYNINFQTLERSDTLEGSGLPVNNSRTLEVRQGFSGAAVGAKEIKTYLKYMALAKVFPRNIVIKE